MVGLADVERARDAIRDSIYLSPLGWPIGLAEQTGRRVGLKLENLQVTGSFKERGALTRLLALDEDERARGSSPRRPATTASPSPTTPPGSASAARS